MSRQLIGALAGAALLLAACSDDGADPVASSPDVTFVTTAPAPTTVAPTDSSTAATTESSDTTPVTPPATTPLTPEMVAFTPFVDGLSQPVDLAWRAGDPALYVVEQTGLVVPVTDGVAGVPVLDLSRDTTSDGEQGLLGLAFHPTEPLAYVNYTRNDGDTVIAEYAVGTGGAFDAGSAREVLVIDQPYGNHNGGDLTFGPDGFLYIGTGDGGAADDPERRALNVSELLGKMLRIDPRAVGELPYTVPADNPFVDVDGARPEIWSVGLRNPWRFNFDRPTGDLWIADVGQNQWEEINVVAASPEGTGRGLNFGWSAWEGTHRFNDDQADAGVTMPIFEYEHGTAGCSVSGGDVYRGAAAPSLVGWYLFSDYCSGIITALQANDGMLTGQVQLGQVPSVSAVCIGPDGELYVLSLSGAVYRVDAA